MSVVEFAEKVLGYKLLTFQKVFLTKCYEAYASNKQLYYVPPRGNHKQMLLLMQYIAIGYCEVYLKERECKEEVKNA